MGDLGENAVASGDAVFRSDNSSRTSRRGAQSHLMGLEFSNVCVDVAGGTKRVLWDISGHASHGKVLAIMGPSGSGKTTLLSALAGYSSFSSGRICFNGVNLTKKMKRNISYVLQADTFFPNLTLRETLQYSALLRLPREYSFKEKLSKVEDVINVLRLTECASTLIGNAACRGLSGGEMKRVSIGCEMLTDPSMILLDEPTSGLDSSSALILMENLCKLAKEKNKVIIASIHQPSSQIYHMFDDLMLLAKGKVAYFGGASQALPYFASRGLECTLHYNPADYMLEMVTLDDSRKLLIGEDPLQEISSQRGRWRKFLDCCPWRSNKQSYEVGDYPHRFPSTSPEMKRQDEPFKEKDEEDTLDRRDTSINPALYRKWPTTWFWQLLVLIVRTFRQSRHIILSKLNFIQAIMLAVITSIIWFQIPQDERSVNDRIGYFFFIITFWGFEPLIVATMSLPAEHHVISKERRSGAYHLSAYYVAKLISELPLVIILPSIFYIITYWAGGFNGWVPFFAIWFILLVNSIVSQGLGLLIGAVFMDFQRSLIAAAVIMLTMMLLSGFFIERLPPWLDWAKYISFLSYNFRAIVEFSFLDLDLRCGTSGVSQYAACTSNSSDTSILLNSTVSGAEVLETLAFPLPWYGNVLVAIGWGALFRILAYFALRFLHRK